MPFPLNIPNTVTACRLILTPVLVILLLDGEFLLGFFVFVAAAVSDALDGLIARLLKQKTTLGSYMDPIADKLLLSSAFIVLASIRAIPTWLAVAVLSRDVLILFGMAILTLFKGTIAARPTIISKITTLFQMSTVLAVLLIRGFDAVFPALTAMFWVTAGFTTVSGLHYVYFGLKLLSVDLDESRPRPV